VSEVKVGETIVVKPGGMVPVDGVVLRGRATVNQASVTGEPMPVERAEGGEVLSGSIVELGALEVETRAVGEESTYGRIITMVREAEENQAPIVRLADRFAGYYISLILAIGLGVYLWTGEPIRMASVFIIACPCALTLATPMAVAASIGNSARKGILIRDGESLQRLSEVDTVVMDKTGTLTAGRPEIVEVRGFGGTSDEEALRLAAGAERHSEHPVARAVLKKAEEMGVDPEECSEFDVHPGLGICVSHGDTRLTVGSEKLLRTNNIRLTAEASSFLDREEATQSTVFVAKDDEVVGALLVSDTIRDNAREILAEAKLSGARRTVMLTGDRRVVAEAVGRQTGVDEVVADLLPAEKVEHIKRLKAEGGVVLMVGDGINDAPALATADVGVAMGLTGTDIAIETAGITLATNNLDRVPKLLRIGRATMRVVKLNIAFALIANAAGITLSVLGVISPLAASVIHEGNALLVMLNALRLLKVD
jgi:Cd2+/Zn2+-exporting ATPase